MIRLHALVAYTFVTLGPFVPATEALGVDVGLGLITSLEVSFDANDAVYDSSRNVIYASIASSAGFPDGNSILTIDPSNLGIIAQTNAGSEPTEMAISADDSRVYVGIDGARAFRSFMPETGALGPLVPLFSRFGDPAVAEDLAVSPLDPTVVVVSKDEVGSSASGDLEVFDDSGPIGGPDMFFPDANSITFTDADTLMTYNNGNTGFDLARLNFDGVDLFEEDSVGDLVSGFGARMK